MKISIVAGGSRGDVQPYIALGKGLSAAGHGVQILTSPDFEALVSEAGLIFCSVGESVESILQSEAWRKTIEGANFLAILSRMNAEMKHRAQAIALSLPTLLEGSDLVMAGVGGMGGTFSIAEKLNIPILQAYVFPLTPTRAFPAPLTPILPFGSTFNHLSFYAMRQMLWQTGRVADVTTRRMLGMPKGSFLGPYRALRQRGVPILYGYSRHVLPQPADWDSLHHVTGYWFLDAPEAWQPPAALLDFLRAGAPPIYVGFGSMGNRDPEGTTRLILEALALSGQRGVLASGWGGLSQANLPENVYMLSSVPHSWLFPQMAAVVHHGGAGTTAAGFRAGVPTVVVPFFGDQSFWGKRAAMLGVGTQPIPKRQLTAESLAAAMTQAVSDAGMRQRAAALGQRIRAEDGIGAAVTFIDRLSDGLSLAF